MQRCLFVRRRLHATEQRQTHRRRATEWIERPMRPAALIRARGNVVTALARVREERAGRGLVRARWWVCSEGVRVRGPEERVRARSNTRRACRTACAAVPLQVHVNTATKMRWQRLDITFIGQVCMLMLITHKLSSIRHILSSSQFSAACQLHVPSQTMDNATSYHHKFSTSI